MQALLSMMLTSAKYLILLARPTRLERATCGFVGKIKRIFMKIRTIFSKYAKGILTSY
jgi:hypothetical protein